MMPLIKVKAIIKETNLGLIFSGIESTSQEFISLEMVLRSEDIQSFFPLDGKIVLKMYSGEYLVVSGDIDELMYEIDTLEYPDSYEAEIELEQENDE